MIENTTAMSEAEQRPVELGIPEAAYEAAERVSKTYVADVDALDAASDAINAAGPLIVAAELRRIADTFDQWHVEAVTAIREGRHSHKGLVRSYAVRDGLRDRADELDPEGRQHA